MFPRALALVALASCGDALPQGPPLLVDANGYFAAEGPGLGEGQEWYPGPAVACLVPLPGDPVQPFAGRLESADAEPTFYLRMPDGKLVEHRSAVTRVTGFGGSHMSSLRWALNVTAQRDSTAETDRFHVLRGVLGTIDRQSTTTPAPGTWPEAASPPATGAALAEWAPAHSLFVRFRSVAAAFRFVGETDRLVGRLLAAAGDGRDHGTVRLTLHHLLLPTIWNTNPDSETGVGEVALVVMPRLARGKLQAAVLLRITDPELHTMQTKAGIAQEGYEDHLWRPADDPFPAERPRRNYRRVVGDVEIVSTDERMLEAVAAGVRSPLADDRGYREARSAATAATPRPRTEALFLYVTAVARQTAFGEGQREWERGLRAQREEAGWRWLVERWTGFDQFVPTGAAVARARGVDDWLGDVRWAYAVTDAEGAALRVGFTDEEAAGRAQSALARPGIDGAAADSACRANLLDVSSLALMERRVTDLAERVFVVLGWRPVCPAEGAYDADPITRAVRCSRHGTLDRFVEGDDLALPLRNVVLEGRALSFRLVIDWDRRQ